jgi:putative PEP-CTERM system histidine kinase
MPGVVIGVSHALAALGFLGLFFALMGRWRSRVHAGALAVACLATAVWAAAVVVDVLPVATETLRTAAWEILLLMLLGPSRARRRAFVGAIAVLCVASLVASGPMVLIGARLLLAILGMLLVEEVYREAPEADRWAIKFACIGIGALFAYDFFLYSDAALFHRISEELRGARGLVNALAVPLLAISAARNPRWATGLAVSRAVMLHSATLLGSAIYLLAMASSGYYLRYVGGDWGRIMQLSFLCGACMLLAGVLFSGALRARLKVLINKHFYSGRFDYRQEWMRFTRALAEDGPALGERSIEAIAALVESPAGALWLRRDGGQFEAAAQWNMAPFFCAVTGDDEFCGFLEKRQWVVDVPECLQQPQRYGQLHVPIWLEAVPQLWLVVPLILHGRLFGFVTLAQPRVCIKLDWEVTDVLKIAGSQAASYLAHRESIDSLMVARQFESFNRMSTFIVHDLKNLVFQLSLLLTNAEKHRNNPDFQDDMLGTLDHSVQKMRALLQRLGRGEAGDAMQAVSIDDLLHEAVRAKSMSEPRPMLRLRDRGLAVLAQRARLERVVGHLIQNAIEATPKDGLVAVQLRRDGDSAVVEVSDSGRGMSERFVRERLFKPFETTKTAGMGIGVFESREYVRELGGQLLVASVESAGTTFSMRLPIHHLKEAPDGKEEALSDRG